MHHIRAEAMLSQRDFVKVRKSSGAGGAGQFGGPSGAPMMPVSSSFERLRLKRALQKAYPAESCAAWLTVLLQAVRVFVLGRVTLSQLAQLPGMQPSDDPAASAAEAMIAAAEAACEEELARHAEDVRRGRAGAGGAGSAAEIAKIRQSVIRVRKAAYSPDAALTGSNLYSTAEAVLLRWLSYHHNRAFPSLRRRVIDFQRDLRDGVVAAGVVVSHCPFLAEPGWPLHGFNDSPIGDEDGRNNWAAVMEALRALQLEPPFDAHIFAGRGASALADEGAGITAARQALDVQKRAQAAKLAAAAALGEMMGPAAAEDREPAGEAASALLPSGGAAARSNSASTAARRRVVRDRGASAAAVSEEESSSEAVDRSASGPARMFESGGMLANESQTNPGRVLMGEGLQRACLLACLWLFKQLPGVVPRARVVFECALGEESVRTIDLHNPAAEPIAYNVTLEPLGESSSGTASGSTSSGALPPVFAVADRAIRIEPGATISFPVTARTLFSRPSRARLTFRSRRDGTAQASSLVFELITSVISRPPVDTVTVESPLYEATTIMIPVSNPFSKPANFRVRVIPLPPDAPPGINVPPAAQTAVLEGAVVAAGSTSKGTDDRGATGPLAARSAVARAVPAAQRARSRSNASGPSKASDGPSHGAGALPIGEWPGHTDEAGALTGDGRWPAPIWLKHGRVQVKPGQVKKLPVQFFPFTLGAHAAAIELVDERVGELVVDIRATASLPRPLSTIRFEAPQADEILRDLRIASANPLLERALYDVLQRLERPEQQKEIAARQERVYAERQRADERNRRRATRDSREALAQFRGAAGGVQDSSAASLPAAGSTAALPPWLVDIDSHFFDITEDSYRLPEPALPTLAAAASAGASKDAPASRAGSGNGGSAAGLAPGTVTTTGDIVSFVQPGLLTLVTPQRMRDADALHLNLRPRAPGTYTARLVLTASRDVRVYTVEATVRPQALRRELELHAPAGDRVTQQLPLINPSDEPWTMHMDVTVLAVRAAGRGRRRGDAEGDDDEDHEDEDDEGDDDDIGHKSSSAARPRGRLASGGSSRSAHSFIIPPQAVVPPRSTTNVPITFAPRAQVTEHLRLVVRNTTRPQMPELALELRGVGTEPAPLEEIVVECRARERATRRLRVVNSRDVPVSMDVVSDLTFVAGKPSVPVPAASRAAGAGNSGSASVVPGEANYELVLRPMIAGDFRGSLTFRDSSSAAYCWYAVRVVVHPPAAEGTLRLAARVRSAATLSVELTNPLDREDADFLVDVKGQGLLGDPIMHLGPGETATYELLFSPLVAGRHTGSLTFSHPRAGQLWYALELDASPAPPLRLEQLTCPVGQRASALVTLDNPTKREARVRAVVDNPRNFRADPDALTIAPFSSAEVAIDYVPSSVGEVEAGVVRLISDTIGEWVFEAEGVGQRPGVTGQPVLMVAAAGLSATASVPFRNPFPESLEVETEIRLNVAAHSTASAAAPRPRATLALVEEAVEGDDATGAGGIVFPAIPSARSAGPVAAAAAATAATASASSSSSSSSSMPSVTSSTLAAAAAASASSSTVSEPVFQLLRRQPRVSVPAFASTQIPIAFAPVTISEHTATLLVRAVGKGLTWEFPLRGVAEAPPSKKVLRFQCRARERATHEFELRLPGLNAGIRAPERPEHFTCEILAAAGQQEMVERAVSIELLDATDVRTHEDPLTFRIDLHPSKPFRARTQLVVTKRSGGRWRWEMEIEAEEPDADDTIVVEADVNERASVAIQLFNSAPVFAPCRAGFTLDSAPELSVTPAEAVLPPPSTVAGPSASPGATFVVHYTPQSYGRTCHGRLVIETADDRWVYDVVGTQRKYERPQPAGTKVDTQLSPTQLRAMTLKRRERAGKNFLRANAEAASSFKKPEAKGFHF